MRAGESKTCKVPVIEQVAALAMRLGQQQLMSCLILRAYLKTTYRGVLEMLAVSPPLREQLGLTETAALYDAAEIQRPQRGAGHCVEARGRDRPGGGASPGATAPLLCGCRL